MTYLRNRKPKEVWPYTIMYDDRERNPWKISHPKFEFVKERLDVGDYTIKGHEDEVAIEKKSGLTEFIYNLSGKDKRRFKVFLNKLREYPIRCIVIEDSLSNVNKVFRSKQLRRSHLTPQNVFHWIAAITIDYEIPILFNGDNKSLYEEILFYLFSEIVRKL